MRVFSGWREDTVWPGTPVGTVYEWIRPEGPLPDADRVADYLASATTIVTTGCHFIDEVTGEGVRTGHDTVTDGEWVWGEELAHYVRYHAVTPPPDLLARIRAHGYAPARPTDDQREAAIERAWVQHAGGDAIYPPPMREAFESLVDALARPGGLLDPSLAGWVREILAEKLPARAWGTLVSVLGIDAGPPTDEDRARLKGFAAQAGFDLPGDFG